MSLHDEEGRDLREVYEKRGKLFVESEKREDGYRSLVNFAVYLLAVIVIGVKWHVMTAPLFVAIFLGVVVLRIVGNFAVGSWATARIRQIRAEHPLPADLEEDEDDDG